MMAKIYNILAIIGIATTLAFASFAGVLFGTGNLTGARLGTIAAVLRGELDDVGQSGDGTPTTQAAGDETGRGPTADEMRQARQADHLRGLLLERAQRDVQARQKLLDQALQGLIEEQESLASAQASYKEQRQQLVAEDQDQGFEQELAYVAGLPPKQAKEHIIYVFNKQPIDAVRLLMHLDIGKGKRILSQFKTPQELQIMSQLLEQLRLQGAQGYDATESGTTNGAASP
ncbi:MAG: hypothetical protein PVJ57_21125 [Phycisphaerae bacterium]|jgi:flagellar motility protein MotE (MotC chaperone)